MTVLSLILPEINKPDSTEDPKINTALTTVQNWANGNVDSSNFPKAVSTTTFGSYSARAETTFEAKHSGSASRPSHVRIDFELTPTGGFGAAVKILVGGIEVGEWFVPETQKPMRVVDSFMLAPGEEWEAKRNEAARATGLHASTRLL